MKKHLFKILFGTISTLILGAGIAINIPVENVEAAKGIVKSIKLTNVSSKRIVLEKGNKKTIKVKISAKKRISKKFKVKFNKKKIVKVTFTKNKKFGITALKKGTVKMIIMSKADPTKKISVKIKVTENKNVPDKIPQIPNGNSVIKEPDKEISTLKARVDDIYECINGGAAYIKGYVEVSGGSGEYIYEFVDDYYFLAWENDSVGHFHGTVITGSYKVKIKVIDANNPVLFAIVDFDIVVTNGKKVSGNITTKDGIPIHGAKVVIQNLEGDDKQIVYTTSGVYETVVADGEYEILVEMEYIDTPTKKLVSVKGDTVIDIALDVYKVSLVSSVNELELNEMIKWINTSGDIVGCADTLYLTEGVHDLIAEASGFLYNIIVSFDEEVTCSEFYDINVVDIKIGYEYIYEGDVVDIELIDENSFFYKFIADEERNYSFFLVSENLSYINLYDEEGILLNTFTGEAEIEGEVFFEEGKAYFFEIGSQHLEKEMEFGIE